MISWRQLCCDSAMHPLQHSIEVLLSYVLACFLFYHHKASFFLMFGFSVVFILRSFVLAVFGWRQGALLSYRTTLVKFTRTVNAPLNQQATHEPHPSRCRRITENIEARHCSAASRRRDTQRHMQTDTPPHYTSRHRNNTLQSKV